MLLFASLCQIVRVTMPHYMPAHAVSNGATLIAFTVFIPAVTAAVRPFQCVAHPRNAPWDELSSVQDFPDILCYGKDQATLLYASAFGFVFCVMIVVILARSVYLFPGKMVDARQDFMPFYSVLFLKFKPDGYFFGLYMTNDECRSTTT